MSSLTIEGIRITSEGAVVPPGTTVVAYPDGHFEVLRDGQVRSVIWPESFRMGLDVGAALLKVAAKAPPDTSWVTSEPYGRTYPPGGLLEKIFGAYTRVKAL